MQPNKKKKKKKKNVSDRRSFNPQYVRIQQ